MTTPPGGRRRRSTPTIRPSQILAVAVALALFVVGVVIAGPLGAALVGILAVGAGVLLAVRWNALDERVRLFRAVVVLIGIAVAISLLHR